MAKKKKGFFSAVGSFLGSIPAVGKVKKAAKKVTKKAKKAVKSAKKKIKAKKKKLKAKVKKAAKKLKKKAKKKIGKVFTKARKIKNNLSKSKMVKKIKKTMKKAVLTTKKAAKKVKKAAKAAVKVVKKVAKKAVVAAKNMDLKQAISTAADFIPVVSNAKAIYEAAVGKDPFTGRKLEAWERGASAASILGGPIVKGIKHGGKAAAGIIKNSGKSTKKPAAASKPKDKNSKNQNNTQSQTNNKSGLTTEREKYYRQKIDDAKARGDKKVADDVRYERYSEQKKNKGKKVLGRAEWDASNERLKQNRERGRVEEIKGRNALEEQLGRKLEDNNSDKVVTYTSSEGHLTRPDSIGRNSKGEIDLVHDHKHKTGGKDQTVHNDRQMRAEREMLEDKNGRHVVTISSDKPKINDVPPQPRPTGPLGKLSDIYYTDPVNGGITHKWETNNKLPGGGRWKKID